jgi:hypothetical protein
MYYLIENITGSTFLYLAEYEFYEFGLDLNPGGWVSNSPLL